METKEKKKKKKRHILRKLLCVLLVLALLAAGAAFWAYAYVTKEYESVTLVHKTDPSGLMHTDDVTNILLIGIDTADAEASTRSDSMILLSIDKKHNTLKLTSFMRDMYVDVPGYGFTKLTHACAYEGPGLTVDTIESNFRIRIDGYVKIGYDIFRLLVDGLDGVTVPEIDDTESAALAIEGVKLQPGKNIHLNGDQALQYCRIRKGQSDFQRTARQREVLSLIFQKAKSTGLFKLLKLARSVLGAVESSIPQKELLGLGMKILPCLGNGTTQQQIPADGAWWDETVSGMMVLAVDSDKNIEAIRTFIYGN